MSLESTGSRCEQLARQMQVFGRIIPTAETIAKLNAVGHRRRLPRRSPHLPRAPDPRRHGTRRQGAQPPCHRRSPGPLLARMNRLDVLPDLVARARAAGADAADAVLVAGACLSVQRRLRPHRAPRTLGEPGPRPPRLRRAAHRHRVLDHHRPGRLRPPGRAGRRHGPHRPRRPARPASPPTPADLPPPTWTWTMRGSRTLPALIARAALAEDAALAVPGVTNSEGAEAGYGRTVVHLLTSAGFAGSYARTSHSVSADRPRRRRHRHAARLRLQHRHPPGDLTTPPASAMPPGSAPSPG